MTNREKMEEQIFVIGLHVKWDEKDFAVIVKVATGKTVDPDDENMMEELSDDDIRKIRDHVSRFHNVPADCLPIEEQE